MSLLNLLKNILHQKLPNDRVATDKEFREALQFYGVTVGSRRELKEYKKEFYGITVIIR